MDLLTHGIWKFCQSPSYPDEPPFREMRLRLVLRQISEAESRQGRSRAIHEPRS